MKALSAWFALAFAFSFPFLPLPASAQEGPAGPDGRGFSIFAEGSAARTGQGVGVLWGGSAGTYLQGRFLGLALRGTAIPSGNSVQVYSAVLGPRMAFNLPFVRAFFEAGGGMGHTGYYDSFGNFGSSWAPAWQVDVGLEHALVPRIEWRIVEVAYGRIYAGPGVSPEMLSTGFTLHLW